MACNMGSFVLGGMRARHETYHTATESLVQSPQLQRQTTSKSPGNSHNLFLFLYHKRDLSTGRNFWAVPEPGTDRVQTRTWCLYTSRPQNWRVGWLQWGTGELSLPTSCWVPKKTPPTWNSFMGVGLRVWISLWEGPVPTACNSFCISQQWAFLLSGSLNTKPLWSLLLAAGSQFVPGFVGSSYARISRPQL